MLCSSRGAARLFPVNTATLDKPISAPTQEARRERSVAPRGDTHPLLPWLAIVFVAAFVTQRLWEPGALAGHSAWYDLTRMAVLDSAIRAGDWFPTWTPELYFGYGSPLFQFYAPLSYYLAEIPVLLGTDCATGLKLASGLSLLASGFAMCAFARRHVSPLAASFAGILYMVAPYRFVDLYVRHALGEHCAFMWLPLIALGTERFVAERSRPGLLLAAAATACLILTHNIMAMIGLPVSVAAGWVLGARSVAILPLLRAGVPAAFGVSLATFFWWPALAGRASTCGLEELIDGFCDVNHNFVTVARLLSPAWGFGGSPPELPDPMSVQIGVLHIAAVVGALLVAVDWRGSGKASSTRVRWIAVGVTTFAASAFLCLTHSAPIWNALPLLRYVQFPWRCLALVVFGAAMCGAVLVDRLGSHSPRREAVAFAVSVGVALVTYFPYFHEAWFLAVDTRLDQLSRLRTEWLRVGVESGRLAPIATMLTAETARSFGERATGVDDFLPRGVLQKPTAPPSEALIVTQGNILSQTRPAPNHYRAELSMPEPGTVELRQFWFPGWQARVDSSPVETVPVGPHALVSCAIPAGEHVVELFYTSMPQRRAGFLASCVAGVALLGTALFFRP